MKKRTTVPQLVLLFLALLGFCSVKAIESNTISGDIKGLGKTSLQLILEEDINRKKRTVVAEIQVDEHGRFCLEKKLAPHIYTLKINEEKSIMLAIANGQHIIITGDAAGSNSLQVTGSEDTKKLEAYEKFRKESLNRLVITIRNQIKELTEKGTPQNDLKLLELTRLEIDTYEKHRDELIEFIRREMGTSIAIYPTSIRWGGEKNISFLKELVKRFEAAHPHTQIAARLSEKVDALTANRVGGKVAEIKMPDINGNMVTLSALDAKFILIDFWASWCAPCRRESTLLGELYQKFKPQGFEIYGVGLESTKETWLKAIERDKRTWINVSTFQEFKTPITFDYSITSLPSNVLIDKSGRVIAKNLHGKELKETVEKLFLKTNSVETKVRG